MFCGVPSIGVQQLTKTAAPVFPSLEVGIPALSPTCRIKAQMQPVIILVHNHMQGGKQVAELSGQGSRLEEVALERGRP